jgi:methyl-accepting chemotaxis protein
MRLPQLSTVRARLALGSGALIAGIVVTSALALSSLRALRQSVNLETAVLSNVASLSTGILAAAFDEVRAAELYLSFPTRQAQLQFQRSADETYEYERRLRALPRLDEDERATVARIGALQQQVQSAYSYAHALRDLGRAPEAQTAGAAAREPATEMMRLVRSLSANLSAEAERGGAALLVRADERELLVWVVLVLSIVLAGGVSLATMRSVQAPTERLGLAVQRFSEGDLRPVHLGAMPRELAMLGDAMSRVGTRLRSLVQEVVTESERMSATATDLSAVSQELAATASEVSTAMVDVSHGAETQVGGLEAARGAVEGLAQSASSNADLARRVAERGQEIHRLAERYQRDVAAAATALLDLGRVVQRSASQVDALDQRSESINEFVDVIKQISSQTNLLALNAAIEAARAGERGVGFAVVAQEVRELADSSAAAAEEVAEHIRVVRQQISQVAETMANGRVKVRGVEEVAQGAARALQAIAGSVAEVETAAASLADAAGGNLGVVQEIRTVLTNVAAAANAHASASEQVTAAAQEQGAATEQMAAQASELSQAAQRLRSLVKGFRV